MERKIQINGSGKVKVKPDLTRLTVTLHSSSQSPAEVSAIDMERSELLIESLSAAGFTGDDIKMGTYDVSPRYEWHKEKRVLESYDCTHSVIVSFDSDVQKLGHVMQALAQCPAQPEYSVSFLVKDMDAVSREVLTAAAENARKKAEILCEASGVKLGQLLDISYGCEDLSFASNSMVRMEKALPNAYYGLCEDEMIEPEEITVEDEAVFIWEIC